MSVKVTSDVCTQSGSPQPAAWVMKLFTETTTCISCMNGYCKGHFIHEALICATFVTIGQQQIYKPMKYMYMLVIYIDISRKNPLSAN